MASDYKAVLNDSIERLNQIIAEQQSLEVELTKLRQFIFATVNMLPDDERASFLNGLAEGTVAQEANESNLSEAIRDILYENPKVSFTVAALRDSLRDSGFDLGRYSNALASISTTARRLSPKDADVLDADGVTVYRAVNSRSARQRHAERRNLKMWREIFGETFSDEEINNLMKTDTSGMLQAAEEDPLRGEGPSTDE